VEKHSVLHNLSVCICSLRIQQAMGMRHIVICGLPRFAVYLTFSQKRQDLKKKLLYTKCVLIFSITFSVTFLIPRRNEY
jgi:hypothetical protein